MRDDLSATLLTKLKALPREPGCYLLKDSSGRIIYAGKAKSLKARLPHYFTPPSRLDTKTRLLAEVVYDFDVILTTTEVEALLLERTLIKHHAPRFNVLLRDDKEYPFLRVDFGETWPRLEKVRRRLDDGATYVGPFGSAGQLRLLLDAVYRIFPLIRCSRHEFEQARRPCNYFHMKMCLAPCTRAVDGAHYKSMLHDALAFIGGKNREVLQGLKAKMSAAAAAEAFELAAVYRDQIQAFDAVTEKQNVVPIDIREADAIGLAEEHGRTAFHVLSVRDHLVVGGDSFLLQTPVQTPVQALSEFLLQYYDSRSVPAEVLLPEVEGAAELAEVLPLALLAHHPERTTLAIRVPQRGSRSDLAAMAAKNAAFRLTEATRLAEKERVELRLLAEKLRLRRTPERMECIDISNFQGTAIVASDVCFVGGRPAKAHYRHYTVQGLSGSPDDFASVNEVVRRRLERARRDGDLPDLLVIDGGKGQLNAALAARAEFPELDFELISLAKSRVTKTKAVAQLIRTGAPERSFERVFLPGADLGIPLSPGTPEHRLLTRIRDEAHRFAISHHRRRRDQAATASDLEMIPGIGPKLRKRLLEDFGGLDGLRRASLDELRRVKGLRESSAVALHSALRSKNERSET